MAMETQRSGIKNFLQKCKPYIAMTSIQLGYAGMNIITKVSLNHGMSHYVLVVYRHVFGTLSMAPFALILERKVRPKMTFSVFVQIFALALLGPVVDQNFYYAALKFTSPTFTCAISNMLPAMTFVLAVLFRMEKLQLKKLRCQAKLLGTLVNLAGATLMTLYKGKSIEMVWTKHMHPHQAGGPVAPQTTDKDWLKGSICLIISTLAWASFFILQAATMKKYDAPLSLTLLICFVGTLQAIVATFIMERKPSVWDIGFDMNLLSAAYSGIVASSIAYYVQGLVIQSRGPVFASAFSPLTMILVAIMGSFILAEKIYVGSVLGSVLIVAGLYSVLWGKYKEKKEKKESEALDLPLAIKTIEGNGKIMDIVEVDKVELEKARANNKMISSSDQDVEVILPAPEIHMQAKEKP